MFKLSKTNLLLTVFFTAVVGLSGAVCFFLVNYGDTDSRPSDRLRADANKAARNHEYEKAERLYKEASSNAGSSGNYALKARLLSELGDVYSAEKIYREAEMSFTRALSSNAEVGATDSASKAEKERQRVFLTGKLATAMFMQGKLEEAKDLYAELLRDEDTSSLSFTEKERLSQEYAALLKRLGKDQESKKPKVQSDVTVHSSSCLKDGERRDNPSTLEPARMSCVFKQSRKISS
jgi:tetratricopeptide (TPR) repeat protein